MPLPDAGRGLPESRFVVADVLVRFDHARGVAEVLRGDPDETVRLLESDIPRPPRESGARAEHAAPPDAGRLRGGRRRVQGVHPQGRRVPDRALAARRAAARGVSALALYRALRRVNPSPYLFLLELDGLALVGSSPETLVKCEGTRATLNPIAGSTQPGEGDAERLLSSEKDRAEHVMLVDLGRNDLSRVCRPGTVHVERFLEPERFSHITHLVSEVAGELARRRDAVRPAARDVPGRHRLGRAEGARDADHLASSRATAAGPYAGAVLYALPGRRRSTRASRSARSSCTTASRCSRRAPASSPTATRRAEHEECLRKLAALEAAIDLAEAGG